MKGSILRTFGPAKPPSLFIAALLFMAACLMFATAFADDELERDGGAFCSATARALFKACRHDVRDNFWIAVGNCENLSTEADRKTCFADAKLDRHEDIESCGEQRAARLDACGLLGEAPYDPVIDPRQFVEPAQIGVTASANPYFPLVTGLTRIYSAGNETIRVTVTDEVKEILGVPCVIVRDIVEADGEIVEDTEDWYAQDIDGNVWYFGEIAQNFVDGELNNLDGSWKAGVAGAKAGIVMKAFPQAGDVYRQEFALAEAEDLAMVLSVSASAETPAAACHGDCLLTRDFTPIEPGVNEHKYYAPDIGVILTVDVESGDREELIQVITP
ncbi:MAG: hypothetical protein ACE5ET_04315 [Gammaproteobacteria bacterium]